MWQNRDLGLDPGLNSPERMDWHALMNQDQSERAQLYSLFSNVMCISSFHLSNPHEIVPTHNKRIMQILIEFVIHTTVL